MVHRNVIVDIPISSHSFVFSRSDVQISAGLTNISGLAIAAFDLVQGGSSSGNLYFVLRRPKNDG